MNTRKMKEANRDTTFYILLFATCCFLYFVFIDVLNNHRYDISAPTFLSAVAKNNQYDILCFDLFV